MKRIKLFETFNIESFDDIDDILLSLQDQGILKLKSNPFMSYDESERGTQTLGNLNPKISVIYELHKELLKIESFRPAVTGGGGAGGGLQAHLSCTTTHTWLLGFLKRMPPLSARRCCRRRTGTRRTRRTRPFGPSSAALCSARGSCSAASTRSWAFRAPRCLRSPWPSSPFFPLSRTA